MALKTDFLSLESSKGSVLTTQKYQSLGLYSDST